MKFRHADFGYKLLILLYFIVKFQGEIAIISLVPDGYVTSIF